MSIPIPPPPPQQVVISSDNVISVDIPIPPPLQPGMLGIPEPPGIPLPPGVPPSPGIPLPPGVPIPPGIPTTPGIPGTPAFPGFGFTPATTKTKPNKKPKVRMKQLHWEKLNANSIKDTIWEKIDDTKLKFNPDEFCKLFAQDKPQSPPKEAKKTAKKTVFLGHDRQINIDIILGKIKIKPIDISEALLNYNEEILTEQICNLLIPIFPKDNEYDEIAKKTENLENEEDFAECDLFIVLIGCIPCHRERLQAILFKNSYLQRSFEILTLLDYFFKGFDFVKYNENFHKFLEIFLAHGNYMNGDTLKGGAFGFQLESISKFYDMKSNDNKSTLFQYIIEFIMEDFDPKLFNFLPYFELFTKMTISFIQVSYNSLKENFKSVEALKRWLDANKEEIDEGDDKTETFLKEFFDQASKTIKFIGEKIDTITVKYEEISKFLGLKNVDIKKFVVIMREFFLETITALKIYRNKKKTEEKLKLLEEERDKKNKGNKSKLKNLGK